MNQTLSSEDRAVVERLSRGSVTLPIALMVVFGFNGISELQKQGGIHRAAALTCLAAAVMAAVTLFRSRGKRPPLLTALEAGRVGHVRVEKLTMTESSNVHVTMNEGPPLKMYVARAKDTQELLAVLRRAAPQAVVEG